MRMDRDVRGAEGCNVFLDGEKLLQCYEADDTEGWARCAVTNADGRIVFDANGPYEVATEIRRGVVTFTFEPEWKRELAEAWHEEQRAIQGDALSYAISVIESYQMDLRNSAETLTTENIEQLREGHSLARIGFCQGRIYTEALGRIRELAKGRG